MKKWLLRALSVIVLCAAGLFGYLFPTVEIFAKGGVTSGFLAACHTLRVGQETGLWSGLERARIAAKLDQQGKTNGLYATYLMGDCKKFFGQQ